MSKRVIALIFITLCCAGLVTFKISNMMSRNHLENKKGLNIDVARHPLSEHNLELIIKTAKQNKFDYVQLHLSDNEHLAFQSDYLKNTNDSKALSKTELQHLVNYADGHNIQLVPDVDIPSHMGAILKHLKKSHPKLYYQVKLDDETIDYTNPKSIEVVKKIYNELNPIFGKQTDLNFIIGADEVPGNYALHKDLVKFINQINRHQNQYGFTNVIWNDQILKKELPNLDNNIIINYWSQSGNHDADDEDELLMERNKNYISVKDVLNLDRKIINSNSYVLYYQMKNIGNQQDDQYVLDILNNEWQVNVFNEIDQQGMNKNWTIEQNMKSQGYVFSLWGEKSKKISTISIIKFINKINIPK